MKWFQMDLVSNISFLPQRIRFCLIRGKGAKKEGNTAKIRINGTVTIKALCKWGHFERAKPTLKMLLVS